MIGPITPGPGSKIEIVELPEPGTAKPRLMESQEDDESEDNDGERRGFGEDDIEDDWADPLVLGSNPVSR